MKFPKKLNKGDTVGLICPSSPVSEERSKQCIETIKKMGYIPKAADNLFTDYGGYMAGTGRTRGEWINKMFADPEVDAIFCIRGGHGGSRDFPYVDLDIVRNNPKIFVGYSDVTTWNLLFTQECGMVTFHGPMVSSNMVDNFDEETADSFFRCINGDDEYVLTNPKGYPIEIMKEGKASGPITGGNLSLMSASIGTPYEVDAKGKILFIEDVGGVVGQLERTMYHLKHAGKFEDCNGVIFGQFTRVGNEHSETFGMKELITDVLEDYDFPVMYNIQAGHGEKNMTVPMGADCTMDTSDQSIVFKIER